MAPMKSRGDNLCTMQTEFCLKREAYYTHHPNLTQYFVPVTDVEFRERLEQHQGEIAVMLRSSEFNQDKTTLIVTNNPLPLLISGQHLSTPFRFFPEDLLAKVPSYLPPVKMPEQQLSRPTVKKLKKSSPFRFANKNDFVTEAHFSKNYAEKRLQRLYPNLRTHMRPGQPAMESLPSIQGFPAPRIQWEPLTMSCLTELHPTLTVPGNNGFRYGKAPLWIVNSSVVSRNIK
ncbi:testis-specific gene 13 protein [Sceloporus undulatus]|uniref:testis-specific gene 13 protein n=1 Tax=Sceloporus undulatus TaxID=8520 RepID=UPI001C4D804F|nr:testis-specific gene 13 protein [Sceloporus undulatus]